MEFVDWIFFKRFRHVNGSLLIKWIDSQMQMLP